FVLSGASFGFLAGRRARLGPVILAGLLIGQALDSFACSPHYLSYVTPAVGGAKCGCKYLADSSFDWGQDLPALATWLDAKRSGGDRTPVFLTYFGTDSPMARKLAVQRFGDWRDDQGYREFPAHLAGGWFIISTTYFDEVYLDARYQGDWS